MRSKLFVPGIRPELFSKALRSEADAICLDLEDAVHPGRKAEARTNVQSFLQSLSAIHSEKQWIVRVNAVHSAEFAEDISAAVCPTLWAVILPKLEDPKDIEQVSSLLAKLEAQRELSSKIRILPTIESPRGLRLAAEIAQANDRVFGLQLGLADLFEPLGIKRSNLAAIHHVRLTLRLAAGQAGVDCYDSAFTAIQDLEGFATEATAARDLGYAGKSCIHPSQIAIANTIFTPTEEELAFAARVFEAAKNATESGIGVFTVDGQMIDRPFIQRAEAILRSRSIKKL
ncbi:MAG TPA: CoA ester lyase [Acidobacteriaceae bacterium]|jgi:citrate lyase subunit beta/citryl-CoA lyase|nr:CoA ester lyase [Acidobacteriaceae bacterium]